METEFELVNTCRIGHGIVHDQAGRPVEGIVIHADVMNSVDGIGADITLFIVPGMADKIAQQITQQLSTLHDPSHIHDGGSC